MSAERPTRIAVVGAGAMGTIFASRFARAGLDTVLLDTSRKVVETIARQGVTVSRGDEAVTTFVPATTDTSGVAPADVVLFCVKCYHTEAAAELVRPIVRSRTAIVSLQNGWGNGDTLAKVFPREQIVLGVTYNSGALTSPGQVVHPADQPTFVGPLDGARAPAERAASVLGAAGLDVQLVEQVAVEIWRKLVLNAATLPVAALTGMSAGALERDGESRELVRGLAAEAVAVARASGFGIELEERISAIEALLRRAGDAKPSMLQDFEAGRRTEIDVVNGAVVAAATDHRLPAPLNLALVRLVRSWESERGLR